MLAKFLVKTQPKIRSEGPRRPQEPTRRPPRGPQEAPRAPKCRQDVPSAPQDAPKKAPRDPKRLPRCLHEAPKRFQKPPQDPRFWFHFESTLDPPEFLINWRGGTKASAFYNIYLYISIYRFSSPFLFGLCRVFFWSGRSQLGRFLGSQNDSDLLMEPGRGDSDRPHFWGICSPTF